MPIIMSKLPMVIGSKLTERRDRLVLAYNYLVFLGLEVSE